MFQTNKLAPSALVRKKKNWKQEKETMLTTTTIIICFHEKKSQTLASCSPCSLLITLSFVKSAYDQRENKFFNQTSQKAIMLFLWEMVKMKDCNSQGNG